MPAIAAMPPKIVLPAGSMFANAGAPGMSRE